MEYFYLTEVGFLINMPPLEILFEINMHVNIL